MERNKYYNFMKQTLHALKLIKARKTPLRVVQKFNFTPRPRTQISYLKVPIDRSSCTEFWRPLDTSSVILNKSLNIKRKYRPNARLLSKAVYHPKKKSKLRGLIPGENYTDRATAACWRSWCQLLWIEGVAWSSRRIPCGRNLGFVKRSSYFFFQIAPQLYSRGWEDPVPDPSTFQKIR
jgi:hypothetical protein